VATAVFRTLAGIRLGSANDCEVMMAAYYFHVRDHETLIRDRDGIDLPDLNGVRNNIMKSVLSVLQEQQAADISPDREFQIEDASGRIVLVVPFRLAHAPAAAAC
jgi:hypothetical protein